MTGRDRRDLMAVVAPTTDAVPLEKAVSSYFLDETEAGPRPALFAHLMSHPEISTRGVIAVMGFLTIDAAKICDRVGLARARAFGNHTKPQDAQRTRLRSPRSSSANEIPTSFLLVSSL